MTTHFIQKFVQISFFVVIEVLGEWLGFDDKCANFLNKTSDQSWGKEKVKRTIIWNGGSSCLDIGDVF